MLIPFYGKTDYLCTCVYQNVIFFRVQLFWHQFIYFGFTHVHRCVLALYTQYFPGFCEKKNQAYYLGGIRTPDLLIWVNSSLLTMIDGVDNLQMVPSEA